MPNSADAARTDEFQRGYADFRAHREAAVATPYGPLSPVGMAFLDKSAVRVDGAPGTWTYVAGEVHLSLAPGENLELDGSPLNPEDTEVEVNLGPVDLTGILLADGERRVEVALRGDRPIVRPRDPNNPLRLGHTQVPTFPADPNWVVEGRFTPFDQPRQLTVGAVVPGVEHHPVALGTVTFTLGNREHQLTALDTGNSATLGLHFTDATSGERTWKDVRVAIAHRTAEGTVVIDFNRSVNQPCAFTDYATCPLPPAGNALDVAITAGEKIPENRK